MAAPTLTDVKGYLADQGSSASDPTITKALAAEKASQAQRCKVPADDGTWPADLAEALCRRVAANLANRNLPLGVQAGIDGSIGIRTGGLDREVKRLEGPFRKVVVG